MRGAAVFRALLLGLMSTSTPTTAGSSGAAHVSRTSKRAVRDISQPDLQLGEAMALDLAGGWRLAALLPQQAGHVSTTGALAAGSRAWLVMHGLVFGAGGIQPAAPTQMDSLMAMGLAQPVAVQQQQASFLQHSNRSLQVQLQIAQQRGMALRQEVLNVTAFAQQQQQQIAALQTSAGVAQEQLNATAAAFATQQQQVQELPALRARIEQLEAEAAAARQASAVNATVNSSLQEAVRVATATLGSNVSRAQTSRGIGTSSTSFRRQWAKRTEVTKERKAFKRKVPRRTAHTPALRCPFLPPTPSSAVQIKALTEQLKEANETVRKLSSDESKMWRVLLERAVEEPDGVPAAMLALIKNQLTCLKHENNVGKKCHWDPRVLAWYPAAGVLPWVHGMSLPPLSALSSGRRLSALSSSSLPSPPHALDINMHAPFSGRHRWGV